MQRQRSLIAEARAQRPAGLGQIGHRPSSAPDREAVADQETEFIGAIDCGTTSCRFYIFDQWADVVAHHQIEFEQLHPEPGWHEHDPSIYCTEIDKCIEACLEQFEGKGHSKDQLKGVGIATQRETTLLWDRQTGEPLYNAVAWPDARNASNIRDIRARAESTKFDTPDGVIVGEEGIRRLTGLPLSTYFSATKWDWLKENVEEVKQARKRGTLMAGTVDTWLVYQFTGGKDGGIHITDASNACRTLLFNLHKQSWCTQLCEFFDFPPEALPEVVSNSEVYGVFRKGHLLEGVPIAGLIGDQQAALVGNKCLTKGDAKQTYGTGCFMLYNTGTDIVKSTHGLVTTVAYKMGKEGPLHYALEGSIAVGGSSVTWLRDNLGIIDHPREAGELADEVPDTGGVYFVTGFGGLFAPYWDIRATGMLIGLSTFTTKHHIVRATLEATCFQTRAILDAMSKDTALATSSTPNGTSGEKKKEEGEKGPAGLKVLQVDGGMTGSDVTMQLQADILGIDVRRPTMRESTVLGAALLAGGALGLFGWDLSRPETLQKVNRLKVSTFSPRISEEEKEWKYAGWVRAVDRARGWKTTPAEKDEGSIASVFSSLGGDAFVPLEPRFGELKKALWTDGLIESWRTVLRALEERTEEVKEQGTQIVPQVDFRDIQAGLSPSQKNEIKRVGTVVVHGAVPTAEAEGWKRQIQSYIAENLSLARGFPDDNPQVWEIYNSSAQTQARTHPGLLETQKTLLGFFHTTDDSSPVSVNTPISYFYRLRIRFPGDSVFALGCHIDGGSLERWEDPGFRQCWRKILRGGPDPHLRHDPWDLTPRLNARTDLYNGAGACSAFRMFQGWTALSTTAPGAGTLQVFPDVNLATSYLILRPFFRERRGREGKLGFDDWEVDLESTAFPGSVKGKAQELSHQTHPHLRLTETMVSVPQVVPGSQVYWHCDVIHAVESRHGGKTDSSVLYIPAAPLTKQNATYLSAQRARFEAGKPAPDFPGGAGESQFVGRAGKEDVHMHSGEAGLRALGYAPFVPQGGETEGGKRVIEEANMILGFA